MKRLVYAPRVHAFVKTEFGVVDLSDLVVRGEVNRKVNAVSGATLTLRNPKKALTEHKSGHGERGPLIHPMDPIILAFTRIKNRPIQVFAGYVDKAPYDALIPGEVMIQASCTLKRLQYTYFDPGLPFFHNFLAAHGWEANDRFGIVSMEKQAEMYKGGNLKDPGFGQLLYSTLTDIADWPKESIYIEKLPKGIVALVSRLFDEFKDDSKAARSEFNDFLDKIMTTSELGESSLAIGIGSGDVDAAVGPIPGADEVFYVGDSLGVGTKTHLGNMGITFDVKGGRNSSEGLRILSSSLKGKHKTVVFDLFTNDWWKVTEQNIARLSKVVGDRNIILATVNGPGANKKNPLIKQFAANHAGVTLLDWSGKAPPPDHIHGNYVERANLFADAIRAVVGESA